MFKKLDKITVKIRKLRQEYEDEKDKIILSNFSSLFELIEDIGFIKDETSYYFHLTNKNDYYTFKLDFEEQKNIFFISWFDLKKRENWFIIRKDDNLEERVNKLMNDIKTEYINFKPYLRKLKLKKITDDSNRNTR